MIASLYPELPVWWTVAALFLFGLCIGSFLNVVIHRLPLMIGSDELVVPDNRDNRETFWRHANLVTPRSACTRCNTPLAMYDNIPLISYLLLAGKCRYCKTPISVQYPVVELAAGVLTLAAFHVSPNLPLAIATTLFCYGLLALTVIDLNTYLLPDLLTLPLMWMGLIVNQFYFFTEPGSAVFGAVIGYISLWLLYHGFKLLTGKEGLGYGDFKLLAALGAWLGWQALLLVILLSSVVGAVIGGLYLAISKRGREHPIPFGPFLAGAGLLALFFGEDLTQYYLQFLRF